MTTFHLFRDPRPTDTILVQHALEHHHITSDEIRAAALEALGMAQTQTQAVKADEVAVRRADLVTIIDLIRAFKNRGTIHDYGPCTKALAKAVGIDLD